MSCARTEILLGQYGLARLAESHVLIALHSTLDLPKVDVLTSRLHDINPNILIIKRNEFINQQKARDIANDDRLDFVADCIDAIAIKTVLIDACTKANQPIIASMGAGGRLDPTKATISHMDKTKNCALAREIRKQLRRINASLKFPVVHSTELPIKALAHQAIQVNNLAPASRPRAVNGAISYMPNIFGMMMAGHIIQTLLKS